MTLPGRTPRLALAAVVVVTLAGCGASSGTVRTSPNATADAVGADHFVLVDRSYQLDTLSQDAGGRNQPCCWSAVSVVKRSDGRRVRIVASDSHIDGVSEPKHKLLSSGSTSARALYWNNSTRITLVADDPADAHADATILGQVATLLKPGPTQSTDAFSVTPSSGFMEIGSRPQRTPPRSTAGAYSHYSSKSGPPVTVEFRRVPPGTPSIEFAVIPGTQSLENWGGREVLVAARTRRTPATASWIENGMVVNVAAEMTATQLQALVAEVHAVNAATWSGVRASAGDRYESWPTVAAFKTGGVSVAVHTSTDETQSTAVCLSNARSTACAEALVLDPIAASVDLDGTWWIVGRSDGVVDVDVAGVKAVAVTRRDGAYWFAAKVAPSLSGTHVRITQTQTLVGGASAVETGFDDYLPRPS